MIPPAFAAIAPAMTLGELFGPLAPIAVFGVIAALVILLALIVTDSGAARQQARAGRDSALPEKTPAAAPVRPAA
jgi:hypothetical protein